ncbi:hypothetical protein F5B21DRAFT_209432 [Xylaria acuta]|nr:hypothetical protein F5B21DRAFT_209432 [Xylaria acuta]
MINAPDARLPIWLKGTSQLGIFEKPLASLSLPSPLGTAERHAIGHGRVRFWKCMKVRYRPRLVATPISSCCPLASHPEFILLQVIYQFPPRVQCACEACTPWPMINVEAGALPNTYRVLHTQNPYGGPLTLRFHNHRMRNFSPIGLLQCIRYHGTTEEKEFSVQAVLAHEDVLGPIAERRVLKIYLYLTILYLEIGGLGGSRLPVPSSLAFADGSKQLVSLLSVARGTGQPETLLPSPAYFSINEHLDDLWGVRNAFA